MLTPRPGGRTRLVVSGYGHLEPRWLQGPLGVLVMEPAHRVMQTRQFAQLRSRVERGGGEAVTAGTAAASPPAPAIR